MTSALKAMLVGLTLAVAAAGAADAQAAAAGGDVTRGGTLFKQRCGVCHSLAADTGPRPGPTMQRLSGRKAGAVPTFKYSPALKGSNIVWTRATLDRFLQGPAKMVPGTFMMVTVANPTDRRDIVAYLETMR